jgi:hypothetical protein
VFRTISATDSGVRRSPIPDRSGHRFQAEREGHSRSGHKVAAWLRLSARGPSPEAPEAPEGGLR